MRAHQMSLKIIFFKHLLTLRKQFLGETVKALFIFQYQIQNPCDLVLLSDDRQFITGKDQNLRFCSSLYFAACHCGARSTGIEN